MRHFYESIEGWFDFQDVYRDMVERAPDKAHFVEVGAFLGRSTAFLGVEMLNSGKGIRLDVVDTFRGPPYAVSEKSWRQRFEDNVAPIRSALNVLPVSSVSASCLYEDESLDFVFIDADHSYDAVSADIRAWLPKVKRGGYLGGHDYTEICPGLMRAVDEAFGAERSLFGSVWLVAV